MQARIEKILKYEGLIAATFTSFGKNGSIDTSHIPDYVDHLLNNGVTGIFLNGTTGESVSLSVPERKEALEKWGEASKDRLLMICQIGASCILEARELAQHAEKQGVDAIATIPPVYYRPNNEEELVQYLEEISSAAPNTPLVYYHIPKMTGVNVSLSSFVEKAKKRVPNFCGAKYTSTDLSDLVHCQMKWGREFKLMLGAEELMLGVLPYGINSFIGISFNMFAPLAKDLIRLHESRDITGALEKQNKLITTLETILKHGQLVPALKETMILLTGIQVGNPRIPIFPLEETKKLSLAQDLKTLGY